MNAPAPKEKANLYTPRFRAAFVNVFKPKGIKGQPNSEPKYSIVCLFEPGADLTEMKNEISRVAAAKWGQETTQKLHKAGKLKLPFKDQSSMADEYAGFQDGAVYIQMSSNRKPGVVDERAKTINEMEEDKFKSGDYAHAMYNAYAWEHPTGGKGVSLGLLAVQKLATGEALGGGRVNAENVFAPVEGAETAADVFEGSLFD